MKLTALVKRPDPETGVDQRGGVKHDRDREKLPEQDVVMNTNGKGIQRNIAERVIEEMADQIGKQHQAAGKANLPEADATNRSCELGADGCVPVIQGNDIGDGRVLFPD